MMLALIEDGVPSTWQDLETRVAQILREAGLHVEQKKPLTTTRGTVEIDVFAEDESVKPAIITLVECKHWKRPVPQAVVHAFRTVVLESEANVGLMVSLSGFQAGAESAAALTNIHLVDWYIFQSLFAERWYGNYMSKRADEAIDPLHEYTEPINSRIFRKAGALPETRQLEFGRLQRKHFVVPHILIPMYMPPSYLAKGSRHGPPTLPLRQALPKNFLNAPGEVPASILDATSLRGLLDAIVEYCTVATGEFDEVFGERA